MTTGTGRGPWLPAALPLALLAGAGCRAPAAPRRLEVQIRGMAFTPAVLEAAPGDTIVWLSRDIVPHTATAPGASGWDTGVLNPGQNGILVARLRGDFPYACALHPTMAARLLVR